MEIYSSKLVVSHGASNNIPLTDILLSRKEKVDIEPALFQWYCTVPVESAWVKRNWNYSNMALKKKKKKSDNSPAGFFLY